MRVSRCIDEIVVLIDSNLQVEFGGFLSRLAHVIVMLCLSTATRLRIKAPPIKIIHPLWPY